MRKYNFIIFLLLGLVFPLKAQLFDAGPDRTICSGTGTDLGTNAEIPSSWCITWSPAEGLDDIHSARPHATPKKDTRYVATVLTDSWESISTDDVLIKVGFGVIKFSPAYLEQGSNHTVQATVTINPDHEPVTWAFAGASKGCALDTMTGIITPGNEYGTITMKAFKTNHPGCKATEDININEGTKDVEARDFAHSGRVAKGGVDTLYLIAESAANITAIPNESGFTDGSPYWYDDGNEHVILPEDGDPEYFYNTVASGDTAIFIAGSDVGGYEPKVIVCTLNYSELSIDLGAVVLGFKDRFKQINEFLKKNIAKRYPAIPNLSVEVNIGSMKYKKGRAEKYNNPGWDYKYTFEAGGSAKLSGKIFHPEFTGSLDLNLFGLSLSSELYIEPFFESSFTGSVIKDPSISNPDWNFLNPVKASVTGGVRGVFNIIGTGANYKITGGFNLAAKLTADLTFNTQTGELRIKFTLAPLQGNTKIGVEKLTDPKKKYTFLDYTVDLFDRWSSTNFLIHTFGQE